MTATDLDPVCAFHGKKWSEHEGNRCLHCPICFRSDFGYPKWVDGEGQAWDVCRFCGEAEEPVTAADLNTVRPRNWYRIYNLRHRLRWGHWPVWGATYGACGWYLTECKHCGKWC